jgi:hypothetical protein
MALSHSPKTALSWRPVGVPAPFNADLELAVLDREGTHALVFPCRRILGGWVNATTKKRLDVEAYALEKMAALTRFLFAVFSLAAASSASASASNFSMKLPSNER